MTCVDCGVCWDCNYYAEPTAPESLIYNLQVAYRTREWNNYPKILAPEFIFKFQAVDASNLGYDFWTRDQDSTGTRALLATNDVSDIRIALTYNKRDTVDLVPPVDSLRIRIIITDLQVDQTDGTTWIVNSQQDMFFRKGFETKGENPRYWWLYEWDELPSVPDSLSSEHVRNTSWGNLKSRYAR